MDGASCDCKLGTSVLQIMGVQKGSCSQTSYLVPTAQVLKVVKVHEISKIYFELFPATLQEVHYLDKHKAAKPCQRAGFLS